MEKFGGQTTAEYLQQANDALVTVVQIETKEALENVWHDSGSALAGMAADTMATGLR